MSQSQKPQLSKRTRVEDRFPFAGKSELRKEDGFAVWAAPTERYGKPDDNLETRTKYKHDEDEITYCKAFWRLSHKSQIIVRPESDHFRSRLTHTLEVNRIADSIAGCLGLNTHLVNAIALGHDIGHCPFGHAGEREMQNIARMVLLDSKPGLCDESELAKCLSALYDRKIDAWVTKKDGKPDNNHYLFHHAANSVRIMQRKMRNIQRETIDGVLQHSWSPWGSSSKFGVPTTYEAQAVAIADQVAAINHDTEDILTCEGSGFKGDIQKYRKSIKDFMERGGNKYGIDNPDTMLDEWFLPTKVKGAEKGFGRKERLQRIINDIVSESIKLFEDNGRPRVTSKGARRSHICIVAETGRFLSAYEDFVRNEIIRSVPWFQQRDTVAQALIQTSFNFFWHYGHDKENKPKREDFAELTDEAVLLIDNFAKSLEDDDMLYDSEESDTEDMFYKAVCKCARKGKSDDVRNAVKTMDYVAGMTDDLIMNVHRLCLRQFRR